MTVSLIDGIEESVHDGRIDSPEGGEARIGICAAEAAVRAQQVRLGDIYLCSIVESQSNCLGKDVRPHKVISRSSSRRQESRKFFLDAEVT